MLVSVLIKTVVTSSAQLSPGKNIGMCAFRTAFIKGTALSIIGFLRALAAVLPDDTSRSNIGKSKPRSLNLIQVHAPLLAYEIARYNCAHRVGAYDGAV